LLDVSSTSDVESNVFYYENIEGGHGGAADSKQQAFINVIEFINFDFLVHIFHQYRLLLMNFSIKKLDR
jgi:hypothetical protein